MHSFNDDANLERYTFFKTDINGMTSRCVFKIIWSVTSINLSLYYILYDCVVLCFLGS